MLETDGTVLRGVVGYDPGDARTVNVWVDGFPQSYDYQREYVFRSEDLADEASKQQTM